MAKGLFSQGVALLTDGRTTVKDVKRALVGHKFKVAREVKSHGDWRFSGPSLVIPFRPDVNGYAAVDIVDQPWPDAMGDPKSDPMTFGAWSMGHFGPFAHPGGLSRAVQSARAWGVGLAIPEDPGGFVRIRLSYSFGAKPKAPVLPKNYDPVAEMMFLSRVVVALLDTPGVTAYFNPNGEVLLDRDTFLRQWDGAAKEDKIPLPLWMNVRFFNLNKTFGFMDTVGNAQLDANDVEAVFPLAAYDPRDVAYYLRNVTHYLLDTDRPIQTGEAFDGPGESNLSWTVEVLKEGAVSPPRPVLRLYPKASRKAVRAAISAKNAKTRGPVRRRGGGPRGRRGGPRADR